MTEGGAASADKGGKEDGDVKNTAKVTAKKSSESKSHKGGRK